MKLYSGMVDPFSQRCRFVLFEKAIDFKIVDVDMLSHREDLMMINPYQAVPVLVERDLVLYEANIINEYIDERFPLSLLMSTDPVIRARTRQTLHRFEKDLFCHIDTIEHGQAKVADKARQVIQDNLMQISAGLAN